MVLAGIDIGSNAVRLQITGIIRYGDSTTFKKLQYIRFPLRLGSDVFAEKRISKTKCEEFVQLMKAFKIMIDLYQVDEYFACATSAMREADNGKELVGLVKKECGLNINIISGDEEAEMINRVIEFHLQEDNYLHIDVGGGSTELNFYKGKQKTASKSFPVGSVRVLKHYDRSETWDNMYDWVKEHVNGSEVVAIGTGGNINKLFELANGIKGKHINLKKLEQVQSELKLMDYNERMHKLQLNADRADVIIPASEIYINVMQQADAKKILVPNVGLKDGIIAYLYEKNISHLGVFNFKN